MSSTPCEALTVVPTAAESLLMRQGYLPACVVLHSALDPKNKDPKTLNLSPKPSFDQKSADSLR